MKKTLAALTMAILAACGGGSSTPAQKPDAPPPVVIPPSVIPPVFPVPPTDKPETKPEGMAYPDLPEFQVDHHGFRVLYGPWVRASQRNLTDGDLLRLSQADSPRERQMIMEDINHDRRVSKELCESTVFDRGFEDAKHDSDLERINHFTVLIMECAHWAADLAENHK